MSTHSVQVIRISEVEKHPNADSLGVVRVFGYSVCVRLGDFQPGDLAAYIEPDYCCDPSRSEFAFLGKPGEPPKPVRIKVKRLRGIYSQGLLIRAPEGSLEGENVMERLGVTRYEPPLPSFVTGGETAPAPRGIFPTYDVESLRRYPGVLKPGEEIVVTEKLHGSSGRYVFVDGQMHVGSRTEWKKEREDILWWRALEATPWLRTFCEAHPGIAVYGEVYGAVQDLRYGAVKGQAWFRAFDLWDSENQRWLDAPDFCTLLTETQRVPVLHRGAFNMDQILALAEGSSIVDGASHIREGCVIKPVTERWSDEVGRVALKVVGNGYLERA